MEHGTFIITAFYFKPGSAHVCLLLIIYMMCYSMTKNVFDRSVHRSNLCSQESLMHEPFSSSQEVASLPQKELPQFSALARIQYRVSIVLA